ncbi:MAG TPA: C1 family peptidase [Polyangiaceae bacterium]|nr:C1 family peptidase [Polyangiaceae bacterium]
MVKGRSTKWYGWTPDLPDHRDQVYSAPVVSMRALPPNVDLRPHCPKHIYDQGQLGSCTANAIACAMEFDLMKQKATVFTPSRLFIYYSERKIEGSIGQDSGAQIRDGIKSVHKLGAPPETQWPYSDKDPGDFQKEPSSAAYAAAAKHKVTSYHRIPRTLNQFKGCLASGYPFVFGFTVYESFEGEAVAKSGILQMPGPNEEVVGGHAVLAVGYDDAAQRFIVRNSWAADWGMGGYFTMPYAYLLDHDLSDDFWKVGQVAV